MVKLDLFSMVEISALSFIECVDTVDWMTGCRKKTEGKPTTQRSILKGHGDGKVVYPSVS